MSSISDKLKSLGVHVGARDLASTIRKRSSASLNDAINGKWQKTTSGDCFVVSKSLPIDMRHGKVFLNKFQKPSILERMPGLEGISNIPLSKFLFIDTETTSLSGGTGTYVFLIGAAKYSKSAIQFKQFFLEDPSTESAQLAALEQFASSTKVIISYNGKAFDLPRLKTRYKLHGWPSPFEEVLHIDLLHIARRLWKDHIPVCSLGEIEYQILGINRSDLDVPGYEITKLFFDYLQSGDPFPLKSIFYHNEIDVISLIALYIYILTRLTEPLSENNEDLISLGLFLSHLRLDQEAITVLEKSLIPSTLPETQRIQGMGHLANLYKKKKKFDKAIPLWKHITTQEVSITPFIELAMFYEHTEKDYQEAIHWTLSAIEVISRDSTTAHSDDLLPGLNHRLSRLKKKLSNVNKDAL